jgi:hypothetical protein
MSAPSKLRSPGPRRPLAAWVAVVGACLLAACAGAPVQAMSDTRQTIRAAEDAGAGHVAPQELAEAREGLKRAEDLLKSRDWRAARREAEGAHAKAAQALQLAQAARHDSH